MYFDRYLEAPGDSFRKGLIHGGGFYAYALDCRTVGASNLHATGWLVSTQDIPDEIVKTFVTKSDALESETF